MRDSRGQIDEAMGEMRRLTTCALRALDSNDAAAFAVWRERRQQVRVALERACRELASVA